MYINQRVVYKGQVLSVTTANICGDCVGSTYNGEDVKFNWLECQPVDNSILNTNDWIEFDIHLIDRSLEEMGIEAKEEIGKWSVHKSEICSYRNALNDEGGQDGSIVYTKDGENFWVNTNYDELKALLCQ